MVATKEAVLKVPVLGIVAWVNADDGTVLGPVEPARLELVRNGKTFDLVIVFNISNPTEQNLAFSEVRFLVGDAGRTRKIGRTRLGRDDTLQVTYTLHVDSFT